MRERLEMLRLMVAAFALVTLSVVLLSSAGIYALMSFTVTRRRREIGIRSALGAACPALGPARRGLRIEPTEALREE